MKLYLCWILSLLVLCSTACVDDDPTKQGLQDTNPDTNMDTDANTQCKADDLVYEEEIADCIPKETDYMPRDNGSKDDSWEACISDDNRYHQIEESISSIARVEVYDTIAAMLWENSAVTAQNFIDARILFEQEQGLGSRVARRYDIHYDPPPEGSCEDKGIPNAYPNYCVGAAVLQPIIVEAFGKGCQSDNMVTNAAKIEAALQWFLYISSIKEATTCAQKANDCDSSWAYYSGGTPREAPIGLAADIDYLAPETHNRAYDGILAVRCWRDLDYETEAANSKMQTLAKEQLDFAMLRAMGLLIRQRFLALSCSTGDYQQATLDGLRILVPLFDRETRERDPAVADLLMNEIEKPAQKIDFAEVVSKIDSTYPCP
ncbi:MAG: hypothetical protein GY847_20520 [Proteobacteria bacterium]|nr:hypothetical protein [Pseudomonadota bacterium]